LTVRAEAEETELSCAKRVAGRFGNAAGEIAERLVVDVGDAAAAFADEVVVWVFAGGFEVRAVAAEVGAKQETFLDEELECAVDGGRVDARELRPDALNDVFGTQVLVGFDEQCVPDRLSLAGEPPPCPSKAGRMRRRPMTVCVLARHHSIMPPKAERIASAGRATT